MCIVHNMHEYHTQLLSDALVKIGTRTVQKRMASYLSKHGPQIAAELSDIVLSEISAFSESRNPDVLTQLAGHGPDHVTEIARLLSSGKVQDFAFVSTHAQLRAQQHFPLEATLHAYRCGHKIFANWLRKAMQQAMTDSQAQLEAISATADFALEYTDAVSTILVEAYLAQTRLNADVTIDKRAELMRILLQGYDESDGRVTDILREAGYLEGRRSYCLVVIRPVDPAEMLNAERARRMVESLDQILRGHSTHRLIDIQDNRVVAVVSDVHRLSGWTKPKQALHGRVSAPLLDLGNAVLAGVSKDVQATSLIPGAYREAQLALDMAEVSNRVVSIADLSVRDVMVQAAGLELRQALPDWSAAFVAADKQAGGVLVDTLRAYADANMNALKAAARLSIHPNTVYFRMQKITDHTGLDARSYHRLTELLLVADCAKYYGPR